LSQATPSQREAIHRLLGRTPSIGTSLSVNLGQLEAILCRAELCGSLSEAVESLVGPVTNRSAQLADEHERWRHVFEDQQSGLEERWHPWLLTLQSSGLLRRLSDNDLDAAESLLSQAIAVLKLLPCNGIPLAELAATALGNSHALDAGQPVATLLLRAVELPDKVKLMDDTPRARAKARAAARREAWANVGVMLDELSSPVLVLNLRGDQKSLTGRSLNLHLEVGEPCRLSVRQLLRHTPSFRPDTVGATVFICENPTVVAAAAHRLGSKSAPLICTDGQPKTAATILLTQLATAGFRLAYHGDFDWPGIQIGSLIMRRHGAVPWRFEASHYLAHQGRFALKGQPVLPSWDARLMQEMIRVGHAVHEEQVLDEMLSELSDRSLSQRA
jgi:uncharacterized protein (TIGR02679 family)